MRNEYIFNATMSVVKGKPNYRAAASKYRVSNRNILEAEIKLEPIQEEWDTTLI